MDNKSHVSSERPSEGSVELEHGQSIRNDLDLPVDDATQDDQDPEACHADYENDDDSHVEDTTLVSIYDPNLVDFNCDLDLSNSVKRRT